MVEITTTMARRELRDLLNRVQYGRESFALVRHGTVCALLVPVEPTVDPSADIDPRQLNLTDVAPE